MIPATAAWAAGQALRRYMVGRNLECVPRGVNLDVKDGWVGAIDGAAEDAMPTVLIAALPHLLTDEMVERAARALHEASDDVFPFDLPSPGDLGRRSVDAQPDRSVAQRRGRYLTTARAALEAALGDGT